MMVCLSAIFRAGADDRLWHVGVAKVDITPSYPVRLTGYASRKTESEGVAQRIYAKAIAVGSDEEKPALLVTVDNCGVQGTMRDEVARRLRRSHRLEFDRFAVCSTHTHCAPWVEGFAPNIFGGPIPEEQQAHVKRYTQELTDAIERVAVQALADRKPARLKRGQSTASFAANRRTKGGPVDHSLPVLFVVGPDGALRAMFATYACHCTTLGGEFNQICGDWAGFAEEAFEREHPGAIALVSLGCAADANPDPRSKLEHAQQYGQEIATAAGKLWTGNLETVGGDLVCRAKKIDLLFDEPPTRAEWETLAQQTNFIGSHARLNLARLKRGEYLPTRLPYWVQTWVFGDTLAMVFLPGEVVVDYALRLKKEFDPARLWINAYANDVPCYIPSERILQEGGYEGGGAMIYYDRPTRFAPGVEDRIVQAVHALLPTQFLNRTTPEAPRK
jgi:hypothetical protein